MPTAPRVCIDANCLTYLIDALEGIEEPRGALAPEEKALVWLFFYWPTVLYISPTVHAEVVAIKNPLRLDRHNSWLSVAFDVLRPDEQDGIASLTCAFLTCHSKVNDCRALAEAHLAGCVAFLSFDRQFVRNLRAIAQPLVLAHPSHYWASLAVPRGATACRVPAGSSPLASQAWTRW